VRQLCGLIWPRRDSRNFSATSKNLIALRVGGMNSPKASARRCSRSQASAPPFRSKVLEATSCRPDFTRATYGEAVDVGAPVYATVLGEGDRLDRRTASEGKGTQRRSVQTQPRRRLCFGVEEAAIAAFGRRAVTLGAKGFGCVHPAGDQRRT
jgi:hypothetical protein